MKNKYEKKKMILSAVLFLMLLSTANIVFASAQPTVTVNPESPQPQSTVTFTADLADIDVINVYIHVQECDDDVCFIDKFNETMGRIDGNTYEASVTLLQKNAVYLEYQLNYLTNDGWNSYPEGRNQFIKVSLDRSSQPIGNDGGAEDTPGFEVAFFLVSIAGLIGLAYIKKKKS